MEKQEFLMVLRECLSGEVPEQEVNNSIRYYEEYLSNGSGKSLEEKLEELGEPRLIAKTIIDTYMLSHEDEAYKGYSHSYEERYTEQEYSERTRDAGVRYYSWSTMAWYQKLLVLVIGCVVLSVLVSMIVLGVNIFFKLALPVLMILFAIRMIKQIFR